MGSSLSGSKAKNKPAQPYAGAQFQPYSYTSALGSTTGKKAGDYGYNVTSTPNPSLTSLGQSALGYAQPMFEQYAQNIGYDIPAFTGVDDGEQRAKDIYAQQSALLQPQFAQQRTQMANDLFGSGRLGLQIAGQGAGAGVGGGMVNPDAFGLARAQSMTMADLAGTSRTQAQQEQEQAFTQNLQGYAANQAARQQQLANYLGGFQGAMGAFGSVADMEAALVNQGLSIEQARSASQAASAQGGAALANAGTRQAGSTGLFGSLVQGAAQSLGNTDWATLAKFAAAPATGGASLAVPTGN